ncbi:maleylacetoacetate isomerase [Vibrio sp. 10N.261.55.A7]|uniref:maleylacetoacetate isomerase n=1 Tax=Vibrio sp. 10N.261.55.A7 TaxID=1880851 RepID=UPI000C83BAF6|nr:maleylacetoacetate isomerase [Vibrio sp. 10N.261.55.A7]PMJ99671.1 maleylacetoacetate isomerase [Vibrio sp. 10N.261.55.A7]
MSETILYGYWRSSAAYRVRIALNLKGIEYQHRSVHLVKNGGEQHAEHFKSINPNELVPVLVDGDVQLNQSLAIIDYLDEYYPEVEITPTDVKIRYLVKSLAQDIAIDVHPINNLRVMQYLTKNFDTDENQKLDWTQHWMTVGFTALEKKLVAVSGRYCVGDTITLVDVCLIPQIYNAKRFGLDLASYPTIGRIVDSLEHHPAFIAAAPENQPDAE